MRVFLTGGTGLVGSHVAEQLVARGHEVRALVRDAGRGGHLVNHGCETVSGDVTDAAAVARGMRGCDALVHAAALVGARTTRERYRDANVAGTRIVFDAAVHAGVQRAIHISSVAVYGTIDGRVTEERWLEVPIHARAFYADSKRDAELEAWRHHAVRDLNVTTVRPALIYGERDRHVSARLARLAGMPLLPLPDGGRHVLPLVYAGNVARGVVRALEQPVAAGRAYNLTDDNRLPLREFIRTFARALSGRPPAIVGIPGAVIEGAARAVDGLSRRIPGLDLPGLTRPARMTRCDNAYDSSRARAELDWNDLVPAQDAIRRTADWLATQSGGRNR